MSANLIRCPGCGVNMDLSQFPVRPDQVVCPRCQTRCAVPRDTASSFLPTSYQQPAFGVAVQNPYSSPVSQGQAFGVQNFSTSQPFQNMMAPSNMPVQTAPFSHSTPSPMSAPYMSVPLGAPVQQVQPSGMQAVASPQMRMPQIISSPAHMQPAQTMQMGAPLIAPLGAQMVPVPSGLQVMQQPLGASQFAPIPQMAIAHPVQQIQQPFINPAALQQPVRQNPVGIPGSPFPGQAPQPNAFPPQGQPQSARQVPLPSTANLQGPARVNPAAPSSFDSAAPREGAGVDAIARAQSAAPLNQPVRSAVSSAPTPVAPPVSQSALPPATGLAPRPAAAPMPDTSGFDKTSAPRQYQSKQRDDVFLLPIDSKGNTEPLAFAIFGFLSTIFLFPPLGLALCFTALAMGAAEQRRGLYNSHRGLMKLFGFLGLALNLVVLAIEVYMFVFMGKTPLDLLGLLPI